MKALKIGLTLFSMLVMVTFSSAQSTEKANQDKERTENIIKLLNLNEEKADKARTISEKHYELVSKAKSADEEKALNDQTDAEIKKLLTEEEYSKYRAYLTEERNPKPTPRVKTSSATRN